MTSIIDLTELQDQVIEYWNSIGLNYSYSEAVVTDPCPMYQTYIRDEYQDILNDPFSCINQLGFNSFSQYMREAE